MATTVVATKAALLAALQDDPDLDSAIVRRGLLLKVPRKRERVYLVGTRDFSRERLTQQGGHSETYLLPFIVEVEKAGPNVADEVHDRAWAIVDTVVATVLGNPEFRAAVEDADLESIPDEISLPMDNGSITKIVGNVRILAHTR